MNTLIISLGLITFICGCNLTRAENIPAFLWGSSAEDSEYSPALKVYSAKEFKDFVGSQQTEKTITLVFYENNLSIEDITQCKREDGTTCFEYLQSVTSKSFLSAVEHPLKTLRNLAQYKKQSNTHLNIDGTFNNVDISEGGYVFVALNDAQENEEPNSVLKRHDAAMKNLVEKFSSKYQVLAIYTGYHASIAHHSIQKREATKPNPIQAEPGKFFSIAGKVLIYFTGLQYSDTSNNWVDVDVTEISIKAQNDSTYNIEVKGTSAELTFFIVSKYGNWYLEEPVWNDVPFMFHEQVLGVTDGFSYHCGPGLLLKSTRSSMEVKWIGLQIEPHFGEGTISSFSEAWDCVGYMSPAIWSGIFVVFVLLFILFIGFSWVFDIKTMDRFDDPKGKTIIITEQD